MGRPRPGALARLRRDRDKAPLRAEKRANIRAPAMWHCAKLPARPAPDLPPPASLSPKCLPMFYSCSTHTLYSDPFWRRADWRVHLALGAGAAASGTPGGLAAFGTPGGLAAFGTPGGTAAFGALATVGAGNESVKKRRARRNMTLRGAIEITIQPSILSPSERWIGLWSFASSTITACWSSPKITPTSVREGGRT